MTRVVRLCVVLGLVAAAPVAAQAPGQPPMLKVAFINSREILQKTPGYAQAESTFTRELAGFRGEVQKLQQQLDSAVQAFDQQSIALSPAAKQAKQRDLQSLQQKLEQRSSELQDRAQQRERELLQPIQARVNGIIQGIRAEGNYSLILDADVQINGIPVNFIVGADPSLNITDKVVARLQQKTQ